MVKFRRKWFQLLSILVCVPKFPSFDSLVKIKESKTTTRNNQRPDHLLDKYLGSRMALWQECSPPTILPIRFDSGRVSCVGWVCCWFSPCPGGVSPGMKVFLSPQKPTTRNFNAIGIARRTRIKNQLGLTYFFSNLIIYVFKNVSAVYKVRFFLSVGNVRRSIWYSPRGRESNGNNPDEPGRENNDTFVWKRWKLSFAKYGERGWRTGTKNTAWVKKGGKIILLWLNVMNTLEK